MKITARTANGINESLSNFMPGCREGYEAAKAELVRTISAQPLNAERICKALNSHRWTADKFEPYRKVVGGIQIKATDFCGNKSYISITA